MEPYEVRPRYNASLAAAWTILSELIRHHGPGKRLRILEEVHESHYQIFSLVGADGRRWGAFNVSVGTLRGLPGDVGVHGWPEMAHYALALLRAEDPRQVVAEAGAAMGFPADAPMPPSTPGVVAIQGLAALLRHRAMDRMSLYVRSGWCQEEARDWIACFPEVSRAVLAAPERSAERALMASRLWKVGRHDTDQGIILDFATGEAFVTAAGHRESLWAMYQRHHSLTPLVRWIDDGLSG